VGGWLPTYRRNAGPALFLLGAALLAAFASVAAFAEGPEKPLSTAQLRRLERQQARAAAGYQVGMASWYGTTAHGKPTASGQIFDRGELTAAHPTLPLNSVARVTNLSNGRSVTVRVNDRGPVRGDRVIDVSRGAARELGMVRQGIAMVMVEPLGKIATTR
jgi:rare lipoprotein A (peptidoglycan hydrolase)